MAGDWIKMRDNLWDDPRVARICELANCGEAQAIGGLYWLWATADQHSADGVLVGLTLRSIDRKSGVPGLGAAVAAIGWITVIEGGIRIERFSEHNGASAKRRALDAKRKAGGRDSAQPPSASAADGKQTGYAHSGVMSAFDADRLRTDCGQIAEAERRACGGHAELEREKEKEKEQNSPTPGARARAGPSAGEVSAAMRAAGVQSTPSHPQVIAIAEQGVDLETVRAACRHAVESKPGERVGAAYVAAVLAGWAKKASVQVAGARAPPSTGRLQGEALRAHNAAAADEARRQMFGER